MITVYGRATSSNVQIVMWTLAELGLAHTRLDYGDSYGGTKTPEYLAMNPMGLVPCLRDGDVTLFESAAIHRYLCARYAQAPFWPADLGQRAALDCWAEWVKTSFMPALLTGLFYPLVRRDSATVTADELARGAAEMARLATMLDARLGQGPWLGGEEFSFADILAGHGLYRYFTLPFERQDLPALAASYQRLCTRPAYLDNVCVSYEPLRFKPEDKK